MAGSPRVGTTGLHACQRLHPMGKPDVFIYELGLQLPRTEDQASLIRIQQGLSTTALGIFGLKHSLRGGCPGHCRMLSSSCILR